LKREKSPEDEEGRVAAHDSKRIRDERADYGGKNEEEQGQVQSTDSYDESNEHADLFEAAEDMTEKEEVALTEDDTDSDEDDEGAKIREAVEGMIKKKEAALIADFPSGDEAETASRICKQCLRLKTLRSWKTQEKRPTIQIPERYSTSRQMEAARSSQIERSPHAVERCARLVTSWQRWKNIPTKRGRPSTTSLQTARVSDQRCISCGHLALGSIPKEPSPQILADDLREVWTETSRCSSPEHVCHEGPR
jgi:hypothetical protein